MTTPQVLVTQSSQAAVTITATEPAVVEVNAPAMATTVEIDVAGPQGPIGPVRQPDEIRVDASIAGVIYTGKAVNGTSDAAAFWAITRTTYNAAGLRLTRGAATGVTWTGRSGHTYS